MTCTIPSTVSIEPRTTGNARVLRLDEEVEEDRQGRGHVDPDDVGARRHDFAHAGVAEVDDRQEQLLLVLLEDPLLPADVDVRPHLLLGRLGGLLGRRGPAREDPADHERDRQQQPRGRRDHGQETRHDLLRDRGWRRAGAGRSRSAASPRRRRRRPRATGAARRTPPAPTPSSGGPPGSSACTKTLVVVRTISTCPAPESRRARSGCSSRRPRTLIGESRSSARAKVSKRRNAA